MRNAIAAISAAVDAAADRQATIEELRDVLSGLCAIKHPVDRVRWVKIDRVKANDYNPNAVARMEMKLLLKSILEDGFTQPIVTVYDHEAHAYVIVDGFHRHFVAWSTPIVLESTHGYVPVVVIDKSMNGRMAATVRHNRARGKHSVEGMSAMIFRMLDEGWDDAAICNEIGMEAEELLRLKHITGFSKLFENTEYTMAWRSRNQVKARKRYQEEEERPLEVGAARRVTFVIISVSDRLDDLNALMDSICAQRRWGHIGVSLLFQDPGGVSSKIAHRERFTHISVTDRLLGCHAARVTLLREIDGKYDVFINLDDDMVLGEHTNYVPAIEKACESGTGFVLTNWAKTEKLLDAKVPKLQEKFVPQILVYNGGGMVYTEKIAALMRQLDPVPTAFDVAWPITAYVNGFKNYRYLGSLAVHRVCGTGGMSAFMKDTPLHVMAEEWIKFRPAKRQTGSCKDVLIPMDKDVRAAAREAHSRARKQLSM